LAFAQDGAQVVVADVDITSGEETAHAVTEDGGEAIFLQADVGNKEQVKGVIDKTVTTYGRLDCACNNAGIAGVQARTAE
jgi:NAD(P)-dependent dehydrogenase (short-subunit alcohol dehydrogenase family)